jgi:hypothetical protein
MSRNPSRPPPTAPKKRPHPLLQQTLTPASMITDGSSVRPAIAGFWSAKRAKPHKHGHNTVPSAVLHHHQLPQLCLQSLGPLSHLYRHLKQSVTYNTHICIPAYFIITQRPATITASARIGFSAPTSSVTNSQGKGKGSTTTKPTCFSAAVSLATTASGGTTPRPTVVYICSQLHRQRVS